MSLSVVINGMIDDVLNGTYMPISTHDGQICFKNTNDEAYIIYCYKNDRWSETPGYYITRKYLISNSVPILRPKYVTFSTDLTDSDWYSLNDELSGENDIVFTIEYVGGDNFILAENGIDFVASEDGGLLVQE